MESTERKIEIFIKAKGKGTLFFPEDFHAFGSSEAIRKALERLTEKEKIVRVAQGIYVRPKESAFVGKVLPSLEEIAKGIAKRDKTRTIPTGLYALNALGLSTQVPMKIVLLTDGAPREIKIGKRTISFKKTTPRNLSAKGEISKLAIQALKELGNGNVTADEESRIINKLKEEDKKNLKHDIGLAPVWIQKIMNKALIE